LIEYYQLSIKGILHVGASERQELESYHSCDIENVYWIEAIEALYLKLRDNLKPYPHSHAFHACIADVDGKPVSHVDSIRFH
jgi:hypothetical protein